MPPMIGIRLAKEALCTAARLASALRGALRQVASLIWRALLAAAIVARAAGGLLRSACARAGVTGQFALQSLAAAAIGEAAFHTSDFLARLAAMGTWLDSGFHALGL